MYFKSIFTLFSFVLITTVLTIKPALAYDTENVEVKAEEQPRDLVGVGIKENLGGMIDLSTEFKDAQGETVQLKKFFHAEKPVMLAIVYYNCPNLCHYQLDGMLTSLKAIDWTVGKDFELVAVSMDHTETPKEAAAKKKELIEAYGRSGSESGWHFLTGTEANIKKLADKVGFGFRWNEEQKQYAHAAASYLVSPKGKITRYLYGIEYPKKDLKLSLMEASSGKIGNVVDKLIFYCFQFDPKKNKYTLYAINLMKAGATVMIIIMGMFLLPTWIRGRKEKGAPK